MNFDTVLEPLTRILNEWINKYSLTSTHKRLYDLTNGQFFWTMLSKVNGIKWSEAGEWCHFKDISTGERVKRMRIVGRTITRFYQEHLQLSLDNLAFNYIDMCSSNPEPEVLRLFIAVLGVLTHSQDIVEQLDSFINQLQQDQAQLFRIMVNYAAGLGEKIEPSESPIKRQKKLLTKLESLEEEIEFYQHYTQQIQGKCQFLSEQSNRHKRRMQQLQVKGDRLAKRVDLLESTNQELNRQLDGKSRQQEILRQRFANNRLAAQEVVDRLVQENQKEKKAVAYYRGLLAEKIQNEVQQTKLTLLCQEKENHIQQLKKKLQKQVDRQEKMGQEIKRLKDQLQTSQTQNEGLKMKLELLEKSFPRNSPEYISPNQQSIVISNRLGDSYFEKTPKEWFTVEEESKDTSLSPLEQSLTFSNPSEYSSLYPRQMGFLNIRDLENSIKKNSDASEKENVDPNIYQKDKDIKLSDIEQQKSIEMSYIKEKETASTHDEQLQLTMNIIFDLHSNLQSTRKELMIFKARQAERASRSARFAAKINDMFG